jgi:hypothetical protein
LSMKITEECRTTTHHPLTECQLGTPSHPRTRAYPLGDHQPYLLKSDYEPVNRRKGTHLPSSVQAILDLSILALRTSIWPPTNSQAHQESMYPMFKQPSQPILRMSKARWFLRMNISNQEGRWRSIASEGIERWRTENGGSDLVKAVSMSEGKMGETRTHLYAISP